jgi:hypothetical protein
VVDVLDLFIHGKCFAIILKALADGKCGQHEYSNECMKSAFADVSPLRRCCRPGSVYSNKLDDEKHILLMHTYDDFVGGQVPYHCAPGYVLFTVLDYTTAVDQIKRDTALDLSNFEYYSHIHPTWNDKHFTLRKKSEIKFVLDKAFNLTNAPILLHASIIEFFRLFLTFMRRAFYAQRGKGLMSKKLTRRDVTHPSDFDAKVDQWRLMLLLRRVKYHVCTNKGMPRASFDIIHRFFTLNDGRLEAHLWQNLASISYYVLLQANSKLSKTISMSESATDLTVRCIVVPGAADYVVAEINAPYVISVTSLYADFDEAMYYAKPDAKQMLYTDGVLKANYKKLKNDVCIICNFNFEATALGGGVMDTMTVPIDMWHEYLPHLLPYPTSSFSQHLSEQQYCSGMCYLNYDIIIQNIRRFTRVEQFRF